MVSISYPNNQSVANESCLMEIILKNEFDELENLSNWVNKLGENLRLSPKINFALDLVLTEIVTNIINYAYQDQKEHQIKVMLLYQAPKIILEIKDNGVPFNPLQYQEIVLPTNLEDATEGGLGIHLVRKYTNECRYLRQNQENILTIVIYENR